jgi:AbrB family looped-hinge helix DNA binding protein
MVTSVVTTKGQVVIPFKLRNKFKIKNGTHVHFLDKGNEIVMIPLTPELIDLNIGFLKTKGKLKRTLMEEKIKEREL